MRNYIPLEECLAEAHLDGDRRRKPADFSDPELPLLLDKVRPIHEVVKNRLFTRLFAFSGCVLEISGRICFRRT
jgi:hypothetical protein